MALPVTVTTNLFSDYKNTMMGPFPRIVQEKQDTSNTNLGIGEADTHGRVMQQFTAPESGPLLSIDLWLQKAGSPTDNVTIKLYGNDPAFTQPNYTTVLANGETIEAAGVSITAGWRRVRFNVPYSVQSGETYWVVLERTGAFSGVNVILWYYSNSNPYSGGKMMRFNTSGSTHHDITTGDARFKANIYRNAKYQFAVDKTNNKVRAYKSTDNETWSEVDSANAPAISSTANLKSISAFLNETTISVFVVTSSTRLDIFNFNPSTEAWGSSAFNATNPTFNTNVTGVAPALGGVRGASNFPSALSDYIFCNNGATESVMGNARRRIKLSRRLISDGTWNTPYDIGGSPSTPDGTLPGNAVDYDIRAAIMDGNGVFHVLWTQSDASEILHRTFNANNTFSASSNAIGSPNATVTNTAIYPIGPLVNFWKAPDWWIAFPFVSSGVLKVARCKASLSTTSTNWTITSIITATIETTNTNPAVLIADHEVGGRLFLFYTKNDGKIYFTHDSGSDTWVSEQELHPGTKTLGAISGGATGTSMGLAYLDTNPNPDVLKFDSL